MCRSQYKVIRQMKKQVDKAWSENQNKPPETDPK